MTLVKGHLNAPVKARARDGKVIQTALHKAAHLVHAEVRLHKIGMLIVEREQLVLEGRKLEEVALLLNALKRTVAIGAQMLTLAAVLLVALLHLSVGEIRLVRHAIPAIVAALIQVARLLHALPEILHRMMLARLGGADKVVVRNLKLVPQLSKVRSLRVGPLLRRHAMLGCSLCHLLAVLVHAGQELNVITSGATITRLHVSKNRGVRGSQVRIGVHVIDGRSDKK